MYVFIVLTKLQHRSYQGYRQMHHGALRRANKVGGDRSMKLQARLGGRSRCLALHGAMDQKGSP